MFYNVAPQLPHDPIPLATILIVEEALRVAWDLLRTQPPPGLNLTSDEEDKVTHALYEVLFDVVFKSNLAPGFDNNLFSVVTREAKLRNYNGSELDKMPDLLVGFVGRNVFKRTQDWLFIECKPVDVTHTVGACYCSQGMIRFVDGRYAWAMREALMIGYVSTGYAVIPKLENALRKRPADISTLDEPVPCPKSKLSNWSEIVHVSRHERIFTYVETTQAAPPITIRHLWLKRD